MRQVVSLSGGKDSTAMLLMLLERGESVDEVVMFDTGMEFPEMYEHIAKLEDYTGMEFTKLRMDPSFLHQMYVRRMTRGKRKGENGYGWPRPRARWCTTCKAKTIDDHIYGGGSVAYCIGIAADEDRPLDGGKRYPLREWGVTEADALAYCKERGFTWGGLYERKKRVSCWCCPLQSLQDLRVLRELHPELWTRLLDMDSCACNQFRIDYSAEQLENRFAKEERQMRIGDER